MTSYVNLSHVNAILNTISSIFLLAGYCRIRRRDKRGHRAFMIGSLIASTLFLISYLIYHAHAGSVRFQGRGWARPAYFTILVSHSLLAALVVPMVLFTLIQAIKERFDRHKCIARWTFPIWLYVSATGVVVYLMLYH